jgi:hypothetical protein
MTENIEIKDPIFKLSVRFSGGEVVHYIVNDAIDARLISPDTRYAVVSSVSCDNPNECTDVTVINLRDVTFIRTERVTTEQLAAEHRMAGMRATAPTVSGGKIKSLSYLKFIGT